MNYAAFLRGVNVNGRKVLKDDLLGCFTTAGFSNAKTVVQTGNVVFASNETESLKLRSQIEHALEQHFGMRIAALVYPIDSIRTAIDGFPFTRLDDRHAYVILSDGAMGDVVNDWAGSEVDEVAAAPAGIYWSVPKGMTLDSPFAKFLAKSSIALHTTARNINTLEKVVAASDSK